MGVGTESEMSHSRGHCHGLCKNRQIFKLAQIYRREKLHTNTSTSFCVNHYRLPLTDPVTTKCTVSPNLPIPVIDALVSNVADRYRYRQSVADNGKIKYTDMSDYVVFKPHSLSVQLFVSRSLDAESTRAGRSLVVVTVMRAA